MKPEIVVIGAGIHGAGVAQAAAAAGYSVLVLEKRSPASGTSCKSSKLIHGGLRYLESGQFKLVRECLYERHLLLKNAPDLVQLKPFYIPVYRQTSRSSLKIRAGLSLYYGLSGFDTSGQFKVLNKTRWNNPDELMTKDLLNIFQYWDAQTNDALLTGAVLKSAQSLGAELVFPAQLISCEKKSSGWEVRYQKGDSIQSVQTKVVVNAAGPWANNVLAKVVRGVKSLNVNLVQGSHIILPEKNHAGIYYLEAPSDKRAVFVMPWGESTMIGTTEKNFFGDLDEVTASTEEIDYLLNSSSHYFPKFANYNAATISDSFAGLRVLPGGEGVAFSKARDTVFYEDSANGSGLVTLYGGKLTAYRATAEQLMRKILPYLPQRKPIADTKKIKLQCD